MATARSWFVATFKYHSISTLFNNFLSRTNFDEANAIILFVSFVFLLFIEIRQERGAKIRESILKRNKVIQWVIFYLCIVAIVLLTAYSGSGGGFAYEVF